ncbi:hypothetical protein [Sphingomonas paucimobilis]|uniref:hypothetical protein n=1 Tax=Sphingomonas paucimobilis TaxID=13689 RepID=UPI0031D32BBE
MNTDLNNLNTGIVLDEAVVREVLADLRLNHRDRIADDRRDSEALAKSQQERLREFLCDGYPMAVELMEPQNRDLLNTLLVAHNMTPKASDSALLVQIADLQMCVEKDGKWATPARRHERIGLLYRIFRDKGWAADGRALDKLIQEAGGTSAIIEKDKRDSRDPAAEKDAKRRATLVYGSRQDTYELPWSDVTPKNSGEWRLALVSVHDGAIRVRKLVGKKDDTAIARERDAYCKDRAAEIYAAVLADPEAADRADEQSA